MAKDSNKIIVQLITDPTFRSWCFGNAAEKENQRWEHWITNHGDCREDILTAKKIVLELERGSREEIPPHHKKYDSWEQLQKRITMPRRHVNEAVSSITSSHYLGWMLTAAATVLLLIAMLFTIEYTDFMPVPSLEDNEIQVPQLLTTTTDYGEQKIIVLNDGTRITLNANSSVTYHAGWVYEDTVGVQLEGEAFFDVTHRASGEGPVFQVQTNDGNIHVLGTRFMVNTWDEITKVVLEEGKVAIQRKGLSAKNDETILRPSERAVFSRVASDITIQNVDTHLYTSWTKGLFEFERAPLTVVADRIEKLFGEEVVIANPLLMTKKVSGSIENKDLDMLLSALSRTLEITIVKYEDQIVFRQNMLEGSFINQTLN
ncbi:FecR family protein [Fodinibius sp. SL11]|uniref:FecR family protein n=1 Tax=Fodinibius sp. SL11 TaxID=3425690 RepID=UPI003F881D9B